MALGKEIKEEIDAERGNWNAVDDILEQTDNVSPLPTSFMNTPMQYLFLQHVEEVCAAPCIVR